MGLASSNAINENELSLFLDIFAFREFPYKPKIEIWCDSKINPPPRF
jgi:hypothetical protein